jgi:hypothetical protein
MSKRQKGRPQAPSRDQYRLHFQVIEVIGTVLCRLIKWGGICVIAFFAWKSIESLSGKTTDANIFVNWLANLKINQWLAWAVTGGSVVWAVRERRLRQRKVAALAEQKRVLELIVDPKRTSSSLPASGTTRVDDDL